MGVIERGLVVTYDTPTVLDDGKRKYDLSRMVDILEPFRGNYLNTTVILEHVHSMPKQGVASSFLFGEGKGIWRGILAAMYLTPVLVSPQRWKKKLELTSDKKQARMKAMELWPFSKEQFALAKHDGRAEALLMAYYGQLLDERRL